MFWEDLNALPAVQTLRLWETTSANEFYFITSRVGMFVKSQTERWLKKHVAPGLTVLISSEKGALCKALKLDYYVDDRAENIIDVQRTSPSTRAYLTDQPWNQHLSVMRRISDFAAFLDAIDQHESTPVAA